MTIYVDRWEYDELRRMNFNTVSIIQYLAKENEEMKAIDTAIKIFSNENPY